MDVLPFTASRECVDLNIPFILQIGKPCARYLEDYGGKWGLCDPEPTKVCRGAVLVGNLRSWRANQAE